MAKLNLNSATLAVALLIGTVYPAMAQVRNYDTVYPQGAADAERQRLEVTPEPGKVLKGRVITDDGNQVYFFSNKKHKFRKADDTVYGHTMELNVGFGGAHLD